MTKDNLITIIGLFATVGTGLVSLRFERWFPSPAYRLLRLTRISEEILAEIESCKNDLNRFSFGLFENSVSRKIACKSFRRMIKINGRSRSQIGKAFFTPGCLILSWLLLLPSLYYFFRTYQLLYFPTGGKPKLSAQETAAFVFSSFGILASMLFVPLGRHLMGNLGIREFIEPAFATTYPVRGVKGMLVFCMKLLERIYNTKTECRCRDVALYCYLSGLITPFLLLIKQRWSKEYTWACVCGYVFWILVIVQAIVMISNEVIFRRELKRETEKAKKECSWIKAVA